MVVTYSTPTSTHDDVAVPAQVVGGLGTFDVPASEETDRSALGSLLTRLSLQDTAHPVLQNIEF